MKAQTSMEFILIFSLVFLFVVITLPLLTNNLFEMMREDEKSLLKSQADIMKSKIDTTMQVEKGYYEEFSLSPNIKGKPYTIKNIYSKKLAFSYTDDNYEFMISLPDNSSVGWLHDTVSSSFDFLIQKNGSGITLINQSKS